MSLLGLQNSIFPKDVSESNDHFIKINLQKKQQEREQEQFLSTSLIDLHSNFLKTNCNDQNKNTNSYIHLVMLRHFA